MTLNDVTLHYFKFTEKPFTCGYGENLNLLLKDAGVDFEYKKLDYTRWGSIKGDFSKEKQLPHITLPVVEVNGKVYNKTVPTMRLLSKQLGNYMGANDEEDYHLEYVADIVRDHLGTWGPLFRVTDKKILDEHFENETKKYLTIYNTIYGERKGPYILGDKISYADFLVYHMIDDEYGALLQNHFDMIQKDYPHLSQFIEAFTQRPRLAEYLSNLKAGNAPH